MAVGLLAAIDPHVAAEGIERFLADPESPPVAGGADDTRRGEIVTYFCDGLLDSLQFTPHLEQAAQQTTVLVPEKVGK